MPMPEGIKVIDAVVRLNPPKAWLRGGSRSHLRDTESLDQSAPYIHYLLPGLTERMGMYRSME